MIDKIVANHDKIDIFCIGTPDITGDAIGPLVGSMLQQCNVGIDVNIVGTKFNPVTATNYGYQLDKLRDDAFVIVVDATVGKNVGTYEIVLEPTKPGGALSKNIEPVGDLSVKAYTGKTVKDMLQADPWDVTMMAYGIATRLLDLLQVNKNKVYIEI